MNVERHPQVFRGPFRWADAWVLLAAVATFLVIAAACLANAEHWGALVALLCAAPLAWGASTVVRAQVVLEEGAVRITGDIKHLVIPIGDIRDVEVVSTTSSVGLFISYPVLVKAEDDSEPLQTLRRLDVDGRPHPDVVAQARALHDHVLGDAPCASHQLEP